MAATVTSSSVTDLANAAKAAARRLATVPPAAKDAALYAIADALEARIPEILEANARDLEAGRAHGLSAALMDRLALERRARARGSRTACARSRRCPIRWARSSTVGAWPTGSTSARFESRSGVIAVVYEARPNVTIDAAALCLKSRQRGVAARVLVGGAFERGAGAGRVAKPRPRSCPRARLSARGRRRPRGADRTRHSWRASST